MLRGNEVQDVLAVITEDEKKIGFPLFAGVLDDTQHHPSSFWVTLYRLVNGNYIIMDFNIDRPGKCHDAFLSAFIYTANWPVTLYSVPLTTQG